MTAIIRPEPEPRVRPDYIVRSLALLLVALAAGIGWLLVTTR